MLFVGWMTFFSIRNAAKWGKSPPSHPQSLFSFTLWAADHQVCCSSSYPHRRPLTYALTEKKSVRRGPSPTRPPPWPLLPSTDRWTCEVPAPSQELRHWDPTFIHKCLGHPSPSQPGFHVPPHCRNLKVFMPHTRWHMAVPLEAHLDGCISDSAPP